MTQTTAIQTSCCNTIQSQQQQGQPRQQNAEAWSYLPQLDVIEWPGEYTIECDAPGITAGELDLTFESGQLHLHGPVAPRYGESARFLAQEYGVGDFDRVIPLGRLSESVDVERISAEYNRGVLTIHLPKLEAAHARKIQITSR